MKLRYVCLTCFFLMIILSGSREVNNRDNLYQHLKFIDFYFENGSPLNWIISGDTLLKISLLSDHERESPNRQTDHWYFKLVADKGTHIKMCISKSMADVYNGITATDWWNYKTGIPCYLSYDNKSWKGISTSTLPDKSIYVEFQMKEDSVFIARLPVYTLSHLEKLKQRIQGEKHIKIFNIGRSVENRPVEIIQLGNTDARNTIIIRARAHPWEPGGNWVVEGLIEEFIRTQSKELLNRLCIYIMPMANKDGVYRGMTRFNIAGMDLNRNWDRKQDSLLSPENYCLEKFIEGLLRQGIRPALLIDFHNDDKGDIHLAEHSKDDVQFLKNMQLLEKLLRERTSFSEDMRYLWKGHPEPTVMSIENGLFLRYGIDAIIYELNANWITGVGKIPGQGDWIKLGEDLYEVLDDYLGDTRNQ